MPGTHKSQSASKSQSKGKELNALDLLKEDHEKVTEMFSEFEQAHTAAKKKKIAGEICTALTVHAQIEEEMFYPDVKAALKDHELVPEAAVEHGSIKKLIAEIENDQEGGEMFDARVKVLSEYVKHHVQEEENEMFPKIQQSPMDLTDLGARMAQRLESLQTAAKHH